MRPSTRRPRTMLAIVAVAALIAAGCGDDGQGEASGSVTKDTSEVGSTDSTGATDGDDGTEDGTDGDSGNDDTGGDDTTTTTEATTSTSDDTTSTTSDAIEPLLAAGTSTCWSAPISDPSLADLYRLDVAADGLSVDLTSWLVGDFDVIEAIEFGTGEFVSDTDVNVSITRWTTSGTTSGSARASIGVDGLTIEGGTAGTIPCSTVDAIRAGPTGLTIRVNEEIRFATGAVSGSVDGAVIRGERDRYFFEAGDGQTATITMLSLENNGVFDLYGPTGELLVSEATSATLVLPQFGDYELIIGGTRGNASYTVDLRIVS
ncbi:MAG: hypothetical protein AAF467_18305 [Actinomycetota bacterium]